MSSAVKMIVAWATALVLGGGSWVVALWLALPRIVPVAATSAIVLAVLVWTVRSGWRAWRAERKLEEQLTSATASQAGGEEVEALRREFRAALDRLKQSRLGGGGRRALTALPWYLVLGAPGAGKSTALRRSGLRFAVEPDDAADPGGAPRGIRGLGRGRHCEWWLADRGIFVEVPGDWVTAGAGDEIPPFRALLELLREHRGREPINGILAVFDATDLTRTDEEVSLAGRALRERIDEATSTLGVSAPVYVIVSKSDLVSGFRETAEGMEERAAKSIFGCVFETAPTGAKTIDERLAVLIDRLSSNALAFLHRLRGVDARVRAFLFPRQLDIVRPRLGLYVEELIAPSPYTAPTFVRGLFFASAASAGKPIDFTAADTALGVLVPPVGESTPLEGPRFLHDLFATQLPADRALAALTPEAQRPRKIATWAIAGAAVTLAFLLSAGWAYSYASNAALASETDSRFRQLEGTHATGGDAHFAALEDARRWTLRLGSPRASERFGMHQGRELRDALSRAHERELSTHVVAPLVRSDVEALRAFVVSHGDDRAPDHGAYAEAYDALRAHLLLTGEGPEILRAMGGSERAAERRWLIVRIVRAWKRMGNAPGRSADAPLQEAHARAFVQQLERAPRSALERDDALVESVRRVLGRGEPAAAAMETLVAETRPMIPDVSLPRIGRMRYLESPRLVPGVFTREGLRSVGYPLINGSAACTLSEHWVMTRSAYSREQAQRERHRLWQSFFARYAEEWSAMLRSIELRTPDDDREVTEVLTRAPDDLAELLRGVREHTRLVEPDRGLEDTARSIWAWWLEPVGAEDGQAPDDRIADDPVLREQAISLARRFEPLWTLLAEGDDSPLGSYRETLESADDALGDATDRAGALDDLYRAIVRIVTRLDAGDWKEVIDHLLFAAHRAVVRYYG